MSYQRSQLESSVDKSRGPRLGWCLGIAAAVAVVTVLATLGVLLWLDRAAHQQPPSPPQAYESLPDVIRLRHLGVAIHGVGDRVTYVDTAFAGPVRNEDLECLANWPHLENVQLYSPQLTGEVLQYLPRHGRLRRLSLLIPGLDDQSLAHLSGSQQQLSQLEICGNCMTGKGLAYISRITDEGFKHIGQIENLSDLALWGIPLTDAGLEYLSGLPKLELLEVTDARLTDAGLVHLRSMCNLRELTLTGAEITDIGFPSFFDLPNLKVLGLYKTRITGQSMAKILASEAFLNLESLDLRETAVTEVDVDDLRRARSKLEIYVDK